MARVTIEDCMEKVHNRFLLVHLAAKRVIQLRKGAKPLVDAPKNKKVVLALREVAAGAIDLNTIVQMEQVQLAAKAPARPPEPVEVESTTAEAPSEPEAEAAKIEELASEGGPPEPGD